jgi:magnesium-transporting ATPase (P-type)
MFDYDPPKQKEPVDYTGLKIGAVLLPVFFLITFLYNADAGLAAYMVLGVIVFAIKLRWYLRKHIWFWAVIAVILTLHVPLVFMVQCPKNAPTIFYAMPIGIADFLIISGALGLAEKLFSNSD